MEKLFDLKTAAEFVFSQASDDLVYLILIEKYIEIKRGKIEDHGGKGICFQKLQGGRKWLIFILSDSKVSFNRYSGHCSSLSTFRNLIITKN